MDRQQYCVYNQTSESFLSLGVTPTDSTLKRLNGIFADRPKRYDEGKWVVNPKGIDLFRFFSARDLVFLDDKQRVTATFPGFPPFRMVPIHTDVASVLTLPVDTIVSSQTQTGNQLVICAAEEMEFRLRSMPDLQSYEFTEAPVELEPVEASRKWYTHSTGRERRVARRKRWPRLVAYDSMGGALQVHGVKDLSAHGLYLMTEDRWPLGTEVTMTLQRTDAVDENHSNNAFTVQLRVIRWGKDGVGLSFVQASAEESPLLALTTR